MIRSLTREIAHRGYSFVLRDTLRDDVRGEEAHSELSHCFLDLCALCDLFSPFLLHIAGFLFWDIGKIELDARARGVIFVP